MSALPDFPSIRPSLLMDFANSRRTHPLLKCTRASAATCFGPDGKLRTVGNNVPRIDYDPATGKCLGLWTEEARTNLLTYAEDFTNTSWNKRSGLSAQYGVAVAPDGKTTANRLYDSGVQTNAFYVNKIGLVMTDAADHTASIFFKSPSASTSIVQIEVYLKTSNNDRVNITYNVATGVTTAGQVGMGVVKGFGIIDAGNGWRRLWVSFNALTGANTTGIRFQLGFLGSSAGDGSVSVLFWGAQLTLGLFPESYMPTEASQVTRAEDSVTLPGFTWSNWSSGITLLAVADTPYSWPTDSTLLSFNNGTGQVDQIDIRYTGTGVATRSRTGSTTKASMIHTGVPLAGVARVAVSVSATNFISAANGAAAYSVAAPFVPASTLDRLAIGFRGANNNPFTGHIRRIYVYPAALTAAQLQRLTA